MSPLRFRALWSALKHRPRLASLTIRGKIFLAFALLTAITALLGLFALESVDESGRLVVATYDKPLMSTSYARLALSKFMAMELSLSPGGAAVTGNLESLDKLADDVAEDLVVADERASSQKAAALARATSHAVADWLILVRQFDQPNIRPMVEARAREIMADFDALVEVTADDGFRDREAALTSIRSYRELTLSATLLVIVLGVGIAIVLSRRMIEPIALASRAAHRIAAGELDVEIADAGKDELGELLRSMALMRDNIRAVFEREVAARRSAQAALVSAVEGCQDGIVLTDADGRVLMANSQFARFFEKESVHAAGEELPVALVEALIQSRDELQAYDGRWLRLSRSPTNDGGFVVIASDITPLKEREAALNLAKEEAEAASTAKSQFLAHMSHELRTPLNAIIGFSEIIATEMIGPVGQVKYKEYASDIISSGRHLLNVINDILDCAKLQSGKMSLIAEPTSIRDTVETATRIMHQEAENAGIRLTWTIDRDLPPVNADPTRLRQVLLNLLSNAIKFTEAQGIVVLTARRADNFIRIAISDTGIGIAADDIAKTFEPFSQIHDTLSRKYGGTGLGLPLTKMLVEGHGGTLTIDSTPGVGTTVSVLLPTMVIADQPATVEPPPTSLALAG